MIMLVGFLAGLAVLLFLVHRDQEVVRQQRLWEKSLKSDFRTTSLRRRNRWLERMLFEAAVVRLSSQKLFLSSFGLFGMLTLFLTLLEQSVLAGVLLGAVFSLVVVRLWITFLYKRAKNGFMKSLFAEAIPIAAHTLDATNRLEVAFQDVSSSARHPRVKEVFAELSAIWKSQNVTPAEALYRASLGWEIPEMTRLAVITMESEPYQPNLSKLWLDYLEGVEQDLQHARMLRAKTLAGRRNGMIFLGIVFGCFALAYPNASQYLTPASQVAFWFTICLMLIGGVWIWRTGEGIDV